MFYEIKMAESTNKETQFRFMLAAGLSMAVLFGWSYLFPTPQPETGDTNANVAQVNSNTATPPPAETVQQKPAETPQPSQLNSNPDTNPNKEITIKTPLYQVKLDSKGAVATSWVLLKNISVQDSNGRLLFADGSTAENQKPLELVSPDGLKREPREAPFRLSTGDQALDGFINDRNFQVSATQENVELSGDQTQQIDYVLKDDVNGLEVTKSFVFHANSYVTDLKIKVTKNGQTVPNTKLLIGASIGDHGINHYNFYQVEPEGVATVDGASERFYGATIVDGKESGQTNVPGTVDWAGIGDTYFAMAVIPSQPGHRIGISRF